MVESLIRLFDSTANSFSTNGIGTLPDATVCTVTEERNGEFELEMEYPINGKRYAELANYRIIVTKPNPFASPQPFRIYYISKPINGIVNVKAEHISYDTRGYIIPPIDVTTANEALQIMKNSSIPESCPFTFSTNVDTTSRIISEKPTSIRSMLLGTDTSLVNYFGGEYEFDNYSIKLLKERGANRAVTIRYGKNMTDFQQEENCSEVFTGVYPFWYSEQDGLMDLTPKTVFAEGHFDFVRIYPLDLSSTFQEKPTAEALKNAAVEWMKENDIGVPKVSFTVSFVQLADADEYEEYSPLEEVRLCDTVGVEFPDYGVSTTSKCVKTVYNVITDKYDSIDLGDPKADLATAMVEHKNSLDSQQDELTQQQQELGECQDELDTQWEELQRQQEEFDEYQQNIEDNYPDKSFMQDAIDHATQMITGGLGGYVVINDSDGDGHPDEILIMDTDNIETAKSVWRWNSGGLGYSSNGYGGPYETAITMDGWIVGKQIAANSVNAEQLSVEYKESVSKEITDKVSDMKTEIDKELTDVDKAIDDLNTTIETTVADGIITESERAAINKMLQIIQKEKQESDEQYEKLYNDARLKNNKEALADAYTAVFGSSESSAYNKLISGINAVLGSKNKKQIESNMETYRSAYSDYSKKFAALQKVILSATQEIGDVSASAITETIIDTALDVQSGKIAMYVSKTVQQSTTITNPDGSTETIQQAIARQQSEINLNEQNINAKVSYSEWDQEFASSIDIWWNGITISSSKVDLTAVYNSLDQKANADDVPTDEEISNTVQTKISLWWNGISITASKIKLEGYTTINEGFKVTNQGSMIATGATVKGDIEATAFTAKKEYKIHNSQAEDGLVIITSQGHKSSWGNDYNVRMGILPTNEGEKTKGHSYISFAANGITTSTPVSEMWIVADYVRIGAAGGGNLYAGLVSTDRAVINNDLQVKTVKVYDSNTSNYSNIFDIFARKGETSAGGPFAPLSHTHTYSEVSGVAASGHNHNGVYATAGHNHSGVYAAASHNHDERYVLKGSTGGSTSTPSYVPKAHSVTTDGGSSTVANGTSNGFIPNGSGTWILGGPQNKWKQIYATNGTINTSDSRLKENVQEFTDIQEKMFMDMRPISYTFRNVGEKDQHDRIHYGFIAQEVESIIEKYGFTTSDFGMLCKDYVEDFDDGENPYDIYGIDDCIYSFRYGEMIPFNTHMIQKALKLIEQLTERLDKLEGGV